MLDPAPPLTLWVGLLLLETLAGETLGPVLHAAIEAVARAG